MVRMVRKSDAPLLDTHAVVRPIPFVGDDAALVAALLDEHPGAMAALYERYVGYVERVLARIVNVDLDISELLHDVFIEAFTSIRKIRNPERLKPWLASIAVHTARKQLKRRAVGRRICPAATAAQTPEPSTAGADMESREALRSVYEILDDLSSDERIVFALRYIEEMELKEVADACRVSLATVKRRLRKAAKKFEIMAGRHALLKYWMDRGVRWEVV